MYENNSIFPEKSKLIRIHMKELLSWVPLWKKSIRKGFWFYLQNFFKKTDRVKIFWKKCSKLLFRQFYVLGELQSHRRPAIVVAKSFLFKALDNSTC